MAKRALLVYNPVSHKAPTLDRLRAAADGVAGWQLATEVTRAPGHASELARRAASDGLEAVVACGGDGTVNEVANGLAGSSTALAVVRGGTANVWAKEVGIPKKPEAALQLLAAGETRSVDLGRAGERYFLCMAGAGFDAAVVRDLTSASATKKRIGAAAYIVAGFRCARRYRATDTELIVDGETLNTRVYWLMAGNTRNYGGVLNIAHMAKADDGKLQLLVLDRGGIFWLGWMALWVLLKRHQRRRDVLHRSVTSVTITTPGLPVQLDGEYAGETPLRIDIAPGALRVIVPRGQRSPLFSR